MRSRTVSVLFFVLACLSMGGFLFFAPHVFAQSSSAAEVASTAGLGDSDLTTIIGRIINVFLGALGVIFLILFIYAGFVWMTAGGDDKKVEKAKRILINATIGIVIVMMAYAITAFVVNYLTDATGTRGRGGSGSGGSVSIERLSGSLGSGALSDHYPGRNDRDVARNTRIMVTFREEIDVSTVSLENVLIYPSAEGKSGALTDASISYSDDKKTFVFDPAEYLGSPTEDVEYTVFLSPKILDAGGEEVFTGANNDGYEWSFATGTSVDVTAPTIETVTPSSGGSYDQNIVVQITFSEPIDPTSATGTWDGSSGFENIATSGLTGGSVAGTYEISNGYKTVTFTPADMCGGEVNSCGETLYCLPGGQNISVNVKSASLGAEPPQAEYPYDGIADMAGNALDGNGDKTAGDAYAWNFLTTNSVNADGPAIVSISPDITEEDVALDQDIEITFGDVLMSSTVSSDEIYLTNKEISSGGSHEQWYRFDLTFLTSSGEEVTSSEQVPAQTRVTIPHGTFLESTGDVSYVYGVEVTEGVKNEYQNCYVPAEGPAAGGGTCAVTDENPYCCNGVPSDTACSLF